MRGWILLALTGFALTGCGNPDPEALVGRWDAETYVQCSDRGVRADLRTGGGANLGGDEGTWRVDGDRLVLTDEDGAKTFRYRLDGDRLHLTRLLDGQERNESWVRCGSPTARELQAARQRALEVERQQQMQANETASPLDGTQFIDNQMRTSNAAGM